MAISDIVAGAPISATGGVQFGDMETALPTDVSSTLSGFTPAGYIGEDGLTENIARSTEKVKAWGGSTVKVLQTDFEVTYTFALIEATGSASLELAFGADNVTSGVGDTSVEVNQETLPHMRMVFDIKDGDKRIRVVLPDAQVTEVGEVTYSHNAVVSRELTVEAFPDESGNNVYMYMGEDDAS